MPSAAAQSNAAAMFAYAGAGDSCCQPRLSQGNGPLAVQQERTGARLNLPGAVADCEQVQRISHLRAQLLRKPRTSSAAATPAAQRSTRHDQRQWRTNTGEERRQGGWRAPGWAAPPPPCVLCLSEGVACCGGRASDSRFSGARAGSFRGQTIGSSRTSLGGTALSRSCLFASTSRGTPFSLSSSRSAVSSFPASGVRLAPCTKPHCLRGRCPRRRGPRLASKTCGASCVAPARTLLRTRLLQALAVGTVDHIHHRVRLVEIVAPEGVYDAYETASDRGWGRKSSDANLDQQRDAPVWADGFLSANVPHVKLEIVVHKRLDVESLGSTNRS